MIITADRTVPAARLNQQHTLTSALGTFSISMFLHLAGASAARALAVPASATAATTHAHTTGAGAGGHNSVEIAAHALRCADIVRAEHRGVHPAAVGAGDAGSAGGGVSKAELDRLDWRGYHTVS